jgi:hypothetical protein
MNRGKKETSNFPNFASSGIFFLSALCVLRGKFDFEVSQGGTVASGFGKNNHR